MKVMRESHPGTRRDYFWTGTLGSMIFWLKGTFGVGKTRPGYPEVTASRKLAVSYRPSGRIGAEISGKGRYLRRSGSQTQRRSRIVRSIRSVADTYDLLKRQRVQSYRQNPY
jgi:hypothetical protein